MTCTTRSQALLIALITLIAATGVAASQPNPQSRPAFVESFEGTDPSAVFGGVLTIGADGAWTGTLTGSSYRLENAAEFGVVRYHYLTTVPGVTSPLSQGTVSIDVAVQSDPTDDVSGAGLVLDLQAASRYYVAFVLTSRGFVLYQRDADGFRSLLTRTSDAIRPGAVNRLTARSLGTEVELLINDARVLTLDVQRPMDGGVGLVGVGLGTFTFDQFTYQLP